MKIGVVADTHVQSSEDLEELKELLENRFRDVDLLLHAGDLVKVGVLKLLKGITKTVAVWGNMDYPDVREVLSRKEVIEVKNFRIGLIHGWGPPQGLVERIRAEFSGVHCIVFGHTHEPFNQIIDGILFFNPGSPTDKIFAPCNSLGFLHIDSTIKGEVIGL
ncbi:MAG: metallophosphoesterase family protein [Actinomycetota bacterium]